MAESTDPHIDLGGYVLGVLQPDETAAFEAHLASCAQCRQELGELTGLPSLLEQAAPAAEPPPHLMDRTFAAIERAAEDDGEDRKGHVDGDVVPLRAQRRPEDQRRHRRRTVELRKVLAVAAAVLAVGFGSVIVRETTRPTPAAAQVIELTAPGGGSARAVARIRPTETGGVIEMEVEGLTPPPPGSFFECWLVAAEGDSPDRPRRISVGTFTVGEDGRAKVSWDFEADVAKFPRMGVTLEPDDGNPVHTTQRVLGGTKPLEPLRR
jgi:anti-sigma-K factor RskA